MAKEIDSKLDAPIANQHNLNHLTSVRSTSFWNEDYTKRRDKSITRRTNRLTFIPFQHDRLNVPNQIYAHSEAPQPARSIFNTIPRVIENRRTTETILVRLSKGFGTMIRFRSIDLSAGCSICGRYLSLFAILAEWQDDDDDAVDALSVPSKPI